MTVAATKATTAGHKLKYLASINDDVLGEDIDPDSELQYIDISNVDSSGRISEMASHRFEDAPSRARRLVQDGDVIISTVRTYLEAITQIQEPPDNLVVSTGFAVVRPLGEKLDTHYCGFALRDRTFLAEVERRSVGVSYPAISANELADIPITVHPLPKQRAIAEHLESETAPLDALIAAKQCLLELLDERRRAIVVRSVIDELSTYPLVPLRRLVTLRSERVTSKMDVPYIGLADIESHMGDLTAAHERQQTATEGIGFEIGDVLFGKLRPYLAKVWVANFVGQCTTEALVMSPVSVEPRFLKYSLLSPAFIGMVSASTFGSKMPRAEWSFIREIPIHLPDCSRQCMVANHLDSQLASLSGVVAGLKKMIALLKERRAALISAAVAGQIAVCERTEGQSK